MKQVYIEYPVDWVQGYLRYGHKEGTVEMTDEEFAKFKNDPASWIKKHDDLDLELLVDDWRIEDYDSDIHEVEFKVIGYD